MDYRSIDCTQDVSAPCSQRRCRYVLRAPTLALLLSCCSVLLVLYALFRKPSSTLHEPGGSSRATGFPQEPRNMEGSSPEKHEKEERPDVDTSDTSVRGFVLAWNKSRGFLLLKCDKKRDKGVHFQLPGGHVDPVLDTTAAMASLEEAAAPPTESQEISESGSTRRRNTSAAPAYRRLSTEALARVSAARELWEETGIDVREDTQRLVSLSEFGVGPLKTNRYYFFLNLTDTLLKQTERKALEGTAKVTHSTEHEGARTKTTQHSETAAHGDPRSSAKSREKTGGDGGFVLAGQPTQRVLMRAEKRATVGSASDGTSTAVSQTTVQLPIDTAEHSGFIFVDNPQTAAKLVEKHSGGCSSIALLQFQRAVASSASEALVARGLPAALK